MTKTHQVTLLRIARELEDLTRPALIDDVNIVWPAEAKMAVDAIVRAIRQVIIRERMEQ